LAYFSLGLFFMCLFVCLDLDGYFLSHVREFFDYNLNKYFLIPFIFPLFSWNPYDLDVCALNVVPRASEAVLIFFLILFSLFCSASAISTPAHVSVFLLQLLCYWFPLEYPLSHSVVYCWLSVLCLFQILVKYFLYLLDPCLHSLCVSLLLPRFWIIFPIFTLNYFSGGLPASSSFVYLVGVTMFLHLLHVSLSFYFVYVCHLLSAGWKNIVPLICGVFPPWVGLDLAKLSWLGGLVLVFLWLELYFVFLKGSAMSSSVFGGFWGFGMLLGRLSANRILFLFYWKFDLRHLALELAVLWVEPGLRVVTEAFVKALTD